MAKLIIREDELIESSMTQWFERLQGLNKFIYEASDGYRMSCRLEGRAETDSQYWSAYKKIGGKTRKKYLGASEALTNGRLSHVASDFQSLSNSIKDTQESTEDTETKIHKVTQEQMNQHCMELIEEYLYHKGLSPTGRDFKAIEKLMAWIQSHSCS